MQIGHSERGMVWMRRPASTDAVRVYLEHFIDVHGARLWADISQIIVDDSAARQFWLQLFVTALARIHPCQRKQFEEEWLLNFAAIALKEYEHKGMAVFPAPFSWPEIAEEPVKESSGEQRGNTGELFIPPMLHVRTLQVLYAASAYVDAQRQHRGPRWTFVAAGFTILFASLAIGYGAIAHYGYHVTQLWSLVQGHRG